MENIIDGFDDDFFEFSNFYTSYKQVYLDGVWCNSVEHAYQAAKTLDINERVKIISAPSPGKAKRLGNNITLRPDWEDIKIEVMTGLVRQKFQHPYLKEKLLSTKDATLIEGNTWKDFFWGVCNGVGENHLGKILMQIREELKNAG